MKSEANTQGQQHQTRRTLRPRSDVWDHFTRVTDKGNDTAQCNHCHKKLKASYGTTSLKKHIKICSGHDGAAAVTVGAAGAERPLSPPLPCAQENPTCIGEHERPGLGEEEASGDLARMIALRGYRDSSFLEDESFVRSLNTELEVPSRHAAGEESNPASLEPSAPPPPHQPLLLSRRGGSSSREPAGQEEDEASRDLARMIALHGYDPSVVEDDYFRSFVRLLNPGFEVPSRHAIEEMCDGIFDEAREDVFSRIRRVPGRVSLSVGKFRTMEREVLYTACHFIDDEWKLHRVIMDAYVDVDNCYCGPLLGVHQLPLSTCREQECIDNAMDAFSQRDVLDNMLMMAWETKGDDIIHLRNQIDENISNANPTRTPLISTTFMDKEIHSIARCLILDPYSSESVTSDLDNLHLTRQKRQKILSELGLDCNLWAYGEDWYWAYCSLQVLRKEDSTRTDIFAELLCQLYGEIYRAIQRISASSCPTSNICLVELFKLRQVLRSQVARVSGDGAAAYELFNGFLLAEQAIDDVADVLREAIDCLDTSIKDSYLIWSVPLILDPRYKLAFIEFLFQGAFVDSEATSCISEVKKQIEKIYAKYGAMTKNANPAIVTAMAACSSTDPLQEAWEEHHRLCSHQDAEAELDRYLKDSPAPQTESFDILKWWKDNSLNYPTVARMARDALAMPTCSKLSSEQMAHVRSIIRGYSKTAF